MKQKKNYQNQKKTRKGWILLSENIYYQSSHKHEITDTMSLITELLEIQYLEENETSYRDRKMFEDRAEVKDSASDTF